MRYRFYREHKYVSAALNDLERLIARADFRNRTDALKVKEQFNALMQLLEGHAQWENSTLHELLKQRGSSVHLHAENDHLHQDEQLKHLQKLLDDILEHPSEELGYQLYLAYRQFVAENLLHLHEEETIILPELQRLYSDSELRKVDFATYQSMTPEQMVDMMELLVPHMNPSDHAHFIADMTDAQPEKFSQAWPRIKAAMDA